MNTELAKLIEKYLDGNCSEEESRIVEEWYNRLDEDDGGAAEAWNNKARGLKENLDERINASKGKAKKLVFFRMVAAAAILLIGVTLWYYNTNETDTKIDILSYAQKTPLDISNLKDTRLILGEDSTIHLSGKADIHYAEKELVIKSNAASLGSQRIETDKTVYSTLIVPYGRIANVTLADGTKVWLNSGSRLIYPNNFKGDKREVLLQGEAFFDVSHNAEKPFHVYAKNVDVKVLGTAFNVRAYDDERTMSTVLVEGSVALADMNKPENMTLLEPKQMAVYTADKPAVRSMVVTEMYTSWKEGYLYLQKQSIEDVIKTLRRYYNVPIRLEIDEERYFSGRLDLQTDLEEVMDAIALTTGYIAAETERGWVLR